MDSVQIMPIVAAFVSSIILCPIIIPFLRKLRFGQMIREEGPKWHEKKSGTPTMGGIIIMVAMVITSIIYVPFDKECIPVMFVTLAFGLIGFLDDYIKVVMKRNLGLLPWQKMLLQIIVTTIFVYYLIRSGLYENEVIIPFTNGITLSLGRLYIPFLFCVIIGTVNGVNLTDGLDGLACGVTLLIAVFFNMAATIVGGSIAPMCGALAGSLLGFLLYNVYPARVFMGDTGSLALGGFVVASAVILKMPLYIPIVGIIYFAETVSVILQVIYFKITKGKRLFHMAPLHHHFEMCGWPETKVVATFSIVTAVFCVLALINL